MAHQDWSQASERLKGALQNVGLEVILKAGRADAEYSAKLLASVDPMSVKHTVEDESAEECTHPTYFPLHEQWEGQVQAIQRLKVGQAYLRLPDDTVRRVKTVRLPSIAVDAAFLSEAQNYYLDRYFEPASVRRNDFPASKPSPPLIGRRPRKDTTS